MCTSARTHTSAARWTSTACLGSSASQSRFPCQRGDSRFEVVRLEVTRTCSARDERDSYPSILCPSDAWPVYLCRRLADALSRRSLRRAADRKDGGPLALRPRPVRSSPLFRQGRAASAHTRQSRHPRGGERRPSGCVYPFLSRVEHMKACVALASKSQ